MGKEPLTQIQEAQRVLYKVNTRRHTPRHISIKLTQIQDKEKILTAAREKKQVTYKGTPIRLLQMFQQKLWRPEGSGMIYFMWWKEKTSNQDDFTQQGSHSDLKEKSKPSQISKSWENSATLNQPYNKY